MIDTLLNFLNQQEVIQAIIIIGSMILFFIGLFGMLTQKHFIKIFISIEIMEIAIFIFFIGLIFQRGKTAPMLGDGITKFVNMNDPIPHAMILTAIVIGMAVLALGVSMAIEYNKLTGVTDIDKMKGLKN
ncbi:putative Na(+) H(+) antiporter subunit C [hydrothermal vent metagenome]|uniref:Putative Na(+) H(+) antiporter subunit C n=1 Tax=hydrothermal vent metagenome TaxID=652676 RepID=A0A1W1BQH8_9ZZZZ